MSKSSPATSPKNPTPLPAKSAWSRGPPQTTAPSPRSQSPAPSTPVTQTHSRRPSTLGQGVPVKDGVTIPRNNVGSVKQAVTFGSIDDASAPISSSPAPAPAIKSEGVKSFGTVPAAATGHVNGKASISSRTSVVTASSSSIPSSSTATAATQSKPKIDIKKMFQNPSSAPSSNPPSDTSSPSMRNTNLPSQQASSSSHPPPSQLGSHSFTPFVPSGQMRPQQHGGPNGAPPRSPSYPRQMPNGAGPRPQTGQTSGPPAGLSSPRLGPHPQPSSMQPPTQMQPHMQPQMHPPMGMPWPGYYYPDQPPYVYAPWYPSMPMQPPHQPPPHGGMPMSPRNPPTNLQAPGTPTMSHALPNPVHAPHPPPSMSHPTTSIGGLTSPPPTPSSSSIPPNRLNAASSTFVPRTTKVTLKKEDGTEVNLENLKHTTPAQSTAAPATPSAYRQGSPGTPNRRPASIRIESEDQRKQRLAEEEAKEKEKARSKAEAEEKVRKEKEEAERKVKEAEERKRKEEEAENERIRKEEEEKKEKERLKEEEERLRKEAEEREAKRIKEQEERKRREEEEAEAKREKEKARLEQERLAKEAEEQKLRFEQEEAAKKAQAAAEASATDGKTTTEPEEGELVESKGAPPPAVSDAKEKAKEALRINTSAVSPTIDRRRPGPLDLTDTKRSNVAAPPQSALATARIISDINDVAYPEGVSSPRPELQKRVNSVHVHLQGGTTPPLDTIGLEPVVQPSLGLTRTGSGRHHRSSAMLPPSRQASIGLGLSPRTLDKSATSSFNGMGNSVIGSSKLSSEDRFAASARAASVSGPAGMLFNRSIGTTRTASQGGAGTDHKRTRSKALT
ncbi:hypothetical protein NLJ89_g7128 [Agrocybe chaxingu]|uniref:Uncharacterized protein n=1 Tax=Agrocybe chaxingu TaxID=84603 RepID=A0A9W8MTZ6_9AGAR|nr:hypothetical protein NLJ89_g7128 [Agrocybe chaxingu]